MGPDRYLRRMLRRRVLSVLVCCCAGAFTAAASASAAPDLFAEYSTLAQEYRTPPPLIPVVMPAILGGVEATPASVLTGPKGVFSLAYNHTVGAGTFHRRVDASILLQDLGNRSLGGRRVYLGIGLYKSRKTRVRGKKALLFTARYSPVHSLVWREDG